MCGITAIITCPGIPTSVHLADKNKKAVTQYSPCTATKLKLAQLFMQLSSDFDDIKLNMVLQTGLMKPPDWE